MRLHAPLRTFAGWSGLLAAVLSAVAADRFVAPVATGAGTGATAADAASYLDRPFWGKVAAELAQDAVNVHFVAGRYAAGELVLGPLGDDRNRLSLVGDGAGAIFAAAADIPLTLRGCRNVVLRNLHFTGAARKYGLLLISNDAVHACTAIEIDACSWTDLNQVFYGAVGIANFVDRVTVRGCRFQRVGVDRHAHMLYTNAGARHLFFYDNLFEDCAGAYVRFRNRADYGYIINNTFRTTGKMLAEDPSTATFIQVPLYNSYDPGTESFGTNFVVIGNKFEWCEHPVKRHIGDPIDQANFHSRDAIRFHQGGFETPGYHTLLSKDEGYTLGLGAPSAKRPILANAGIRVDRLTWFGNSYRGPLTQKAAYGCLSEFGAFPKSRGFDTFADITNALTQWELFRDGFEDDAEAPRRWSVTQPGGSVVATTFQAATEGRRCLQLRSSADAAPCAITRDIGPQDGLYFSAWYCFDDTASDHVCLSDGTTNWIVAGRSGFWENGRGRCPSNTPYVAGKWYHVEMALEQDARNYSIWIDGVLISKDIKDPVQGAVRRFPGLVRIAQTANGAPGAMQVDDVQIATLGETATGAKLVSARLRGPNELELRFSGALDCGEGERGRHSATNPLNYRVSRDFFPAYEIVPLAVTRVASDTFVVRLREPITGDSAHVWTPDLRDEKGRPLAADGFFARIVRP